MLGQIPWLVKSLLTLLPWLFNGVMAILGTAVGSGRGGWVTSLAFGLSGNTARGVWGAFSWALSGATKRHILTWLSWGGLRWVGYAASGGASCLALHYFTTTTTWTDLRNDSCTMGASLPVVGDWVKTQCASRWGGKQENKGPALPSETFPIVAPTDISDFIDVDMYTEDVQLVVKGFLATHGKDNKTRTALIQEEAKSVIESVKVTRPAIAYAVKQIEETQNNLLQLLDYLVLYPGGERTWYERFTADFIATGSDGSKGLQRRVRDAMSILVKAQTEQGRLRKTLKGSDGISLPELCKDQELEALQANAFNIQKKAYETRASRQQRVKMMNQMAGERWRWDRKQEMERHAGLAKMEKAQIEQLEQNAVAGPASLAAQVAHVCQCTEIIRLSAIKMDRLLKADETKLPQAIKSLQGLVDDMKSWGLFPQSTTIQEGQDRLFKRVKDYLDAVAEVYNNRRDQS
ncbi:hypothetical protein QBC39DRAFT_360117 [Podospora conica]|nr:hypothetical protein QBC39DRAFT_360117 [Schizothecium conicum]